MYLKKIIFLVAIHLENDSLYNQDIRIPFVIFIMLQMQKMMIDKYK